MAVCARREDEARKHAVRYASASQHHIAQGIRFDRVGLDRPRPWDVAAHKAVCGVWDLDDEAGLPEIGRTGGFVAGQMQAYGRPGWTAYPHPRWFESSSR